MNERIKKLRKALELTQQEFADRIHVSRGALAVYEIGRNEPIDAVISLICREFCVSETWLRTGEGEMFIELDEDAEFAKVCEEINISDDRLIKQIIKTYWNMNESEKAGVRKLIEGLLQK